MAAHEPTSLSGDVTAHELTSLSGDVAAHELTSITGDVAALAEFMFGGWWNFECHHLL